MMDWYSDTQIQTSTNDRNKAINGTLYTACCPGHMKVKMCQKTFGLL
jgi:hypothetical protein